MTPGDIQQIERIVESILDDKLRPLREQLNRIERMLNEMNGQQNFKQTSTPPANIKPINRNVSKFQTLRGSTHSTQNSQTAPTAQITPAPPASSISFIKDYNAISQSNQSGYELRQTIDIFINKYKVRSFKCSNSEIRMNQPELPPKFQDAVSTQDGDYWAVLLRGSEYAVMPKQKMTYGRNQHFAGGMKEVFKSNFSGGTYSKIRLDNAAIFIFDGHNWLLRTQGSIYLN
ncbi:MAG: hypothetical protein IJ563_09025 [Selenomonadaceae bacterium]|nr:hypothetical protein [Selenomonadaceae bacterium]MBR1859521.1 hypothetical protein [Selenomonadaceae bacterium]